MNTKNTFRLGISLILMSAVTFGVSGPFAKSLMDAGWSPCAAVTARMAGGALAMALFATIVHRGWLAEAFAHGKTLVMYGIVPIAGSQLCFYNAVAHLSVSVALLLEYLAPVLVVGWVWGTTYRRPAAQTLAGATLALTGSTIVLDVFSGAHIDAVGVAWALGAAFCSAGYFVLSDQMSATDVDLNPVTLAAGGLIVGAASVTTLGMCGLVPMSFTSKSTIVAGHATSFLVPIVVLSIVATAVAYVLNISGVAHLGPSYASLLGLVEVLCTVLWAWLLVGEAITPAQVIGGGVVLLGLVLAGRSTNRTAEGVNTTTPPPHQNRRSTKVGSARVHV